MNIIYSDLTKSDYGEVKRLIKQAWFSDYNFSPRIIEQYANGYLYMYLSELDYCKVVKDTDANDKVIGFIFGRCNKVGIKTRLKYKAKLFFVMLSLLFTKTGRRGLKINRITNKANKALYNALPNKNKPTCELVLFIVDEDYRGKAIGSKLESDFCDHLQNSGKKAVYLYTDTYSNYGFYERRGYELCGEKEVDFKMPNELKEGEPLPKYFIYVKQFEKQNWIK